MVNMVGMEEKDSGARIRLPGRETCAEHGPRIGKNRKNVNIKPFLSTGT